MPASARLVHLQMVSGGFKIGANERVYNEFNAFAILVVQPTALYTDAYEVVRVWFHKAPDGWIEEGDIIIDKVELAQWYQTKRATDENGHVVDESIFLQVLRRDVPAQLKRTSDWLMAGLTTLFHLATPPRIEQ